MGCCGWSIKSNASIQMSPPPVPRCSLLCLEVHIFSYVIIDVRACPVNGIQCCLEKLLVCILLAYVLLCEAVLGQFLYEQIVSRQEIFLRKARVIHECFVLKMAHNAGQQTSDPNIYFIT